MMETDNTLKKLLRETALEKAPENLISDVLKAIQPQPVPLISKPLISRRGWFSIAIGVLLLCGLAYMPVSLFQEVTSPGLPQFSWMAIQWHALEVPQFSRTTVLGFLIFTVFSLLQLLRIKRQFTAQYRL